MSCGPDSANVCGLFIWVLGLVLSAGSGFSAAGKQDPALPSAAQELEVRGRMVCLAEEMNKAYQTDLPTNHQHLYGVKSNDGKLYVLLRTKTSEALFVDLRLHQKELIIRGRTFPNSQLLDVISLRSVRNGVVCDLYYYCDVCSIVTITPGPCMCCRDPVVLVEKPLMGTP